MRKGQKIEVFNDYQNQKDSLGLCTLVSKKGEGLTFYSEEELESRNPTLYKSERWLAKFPWGEKVVNIRVLACEGKSLKARSEATTYESKYDISSNEEQTALGEL